MSRSSRVRRLVAACPSAALVLALVLGLTACGDSDPEPTDSDRGTAPKLGLCRHLEPADVDRPTNDSPVVPCTDTHTAQTFATGTFPDQVAKSGYQGQALGTYLYTRCGAAFEKFLGGDASVVMRSWLSWAWFRPSEKAWKKGARWYRCDVVGGPEDTPGKRYQALPTTARALLTGLTQENAWMTCAVGPQVAGSTKVPCSVKHDWRAVTTIKLGGPNSAYPGDRIAEVRSRDYCSDSVGAWMHYPPDYDFGYSVFHEAEWKAGNRRSICWARTAQ